MSLDSASIPTISRLELREKIKQDKLQYADLEKEEKVLDEPGAHEKELNPYWKSGSRQGDTLLYFITIMLHNKTGSMFLTVLNLKFRISSQCNVK